MVIHVMAKKVRNPGFLVKNDKTGKLSDSLCDMLEKAAVISGVAAPEANINAMKRATAPEEKTYRESWPATTEYSALIFLESL